MSFECVETAGPQAPVGLEPRGDLRQRLRSDCIYPALGVRPRVHEARIAQDAQMFRHARLADLDAVDDLADRPLALAQEVEDLPPAWFRQYLENRHSREYSYSAI